MTLAFLALLGAPYIYDISSLRLITQIMSATECLHVSPSLDPPLTPYFKSALSTTTLAVTVPVFRSVSQPGRIPYSSQFVVHRSALRPTVRSEGLPVTSDDPRISKILEAETDRQTDSPTSCHSDTERVPVHFVF